MAHFLTARAWRKNSHIQILVRTSCSLNHDPLNTKQALFKLSYHSGQSMIKIEKQDWKRQLHAVTELFVDEYWIPLTHLQLNSEIKSISKKSKTWMPTQIAK